MRHPFATHQRLLVQPLQTGTVIAKGLSKKVICSQSGLLFMAPEFDALRYNNASYFLPLVATLHHTRCTV
jgi:hypothetical protein